MVTMSFLKELVQVQTITHTSLKHIKQSKRLRMQGFQQIIMFRKTKSKTNPVILKRQQRYCFNEKRC